MTVSKGSGSKGHQAGTAARTSAGESAARRSGHRKKPGFLAGVVRLAGMTYFGRLLLVLIIAAVIILLDILVSKNQYDLFFLIAGIELLVVALVLWLRFILRRET